MSKIVLCSREWNTSTGRYVRSLVEYLQKIDHKNQYVILMKPEDLKTWQPTNKNFQKMACPYKDYTFAEQVGLKKQLDSLNADLVHFTMAQQPLLYRKKVITTIQDLTLLRFKNPTKNQLKMAIKQVVYGRLNKAVARKQPYLITPSEFVKQDIAAYAKVDLEKIYVTHESADPINDKPEPMKSLVGKQFIMYIGQPSPHKNLPRLIEAFEILKKSHPDLKLVLAGKSNPIYELIKKQAEQKGVSGIVFTGLVSEGELRWLYNNCQAYVFPSLSEGFGLPGLEAMIHNAPVVSSNATCLPEIYADAAHYFDPLNVEDMAEKISEVLEDQKLREQLVKNGKKRIKDFSWKRMAEQTLSLYNKVLDEK
jgi:glycosyltransferase involved in cell wall biosynthesis